MRWHKPSLKSIHSFWGQRARTEVVPEPATDGVRHAMLQVTPHIAAGEPHAALFARIQRAANLQALWYLRGDLMSAIASQYGEAAARQQVATITKLFVGLIPEARHLSAPDLRRKPHTPDA